MSLDLATLRSELREHLGVDSSDLPDASADLLLNRSYWEVMDKFPFRAKQTRTSLPTVAGTEGYTVEADLEYLDAIYYVDDTSGAQTKLDRLGLDDYNEKRNLEEDYWGAPTHYMRSADTIRLHPVPDDVYSLVVEYNATLADLPADGPDIPQVWHEIILFGAVHRGYLRLGDYNRGNAARAHARELLAGIQPQEAKEEGDDRYAGFQILRRAYR